jgi:hypothetical protein
MNTTINQQTSKTIQTKILLEDTSLYACQQSQMPFHEILCFLPTETSTSQRILQVSPRVKSIYHNENLHSDDNNDKDHVDNDEG